MPSGVLGTRKSKEHYARKKKERKRRRKGIRGPKCERCGFYPEHECQLDIHHKDGNHLNNKEANLQTLCANCHRYIHQLERGSH